MNDPKVYANIDDDSRADVKLFLEQVRFGSIGLPVPNELLAIATTHRYRPDIDTMRLFGWQNGTPVAIEVSTNDRNDFYRACAEEILRLCQSSAIQDDISEIIDPPKQPREYSRAEGWA